jgi:large subunit ribosomal protein L24
MKRQKTTKKASKHIREGDQVIAIAGNNKGSVGKVLSRKGDRIVVQGLNIRKKHVKRTQEQQAGGIIEIEAAMHASNVSLCDENKKPVKIRVRLGDNGSKELYYHSGDEEVSHRALKKSN